MHLKFTYEACSKPINNTKARKYTCRSYLYVNVLRNGCGKVQKVRCFSSYEHKRIKHDWSVMLKIKQKAFFANSEPFLLTVNLSC